MDSTVFKEIKLYLKT